MARISARGDTAAIKLRKQDGSLVVLTRKGRLLAQSYRGGGYTVVDAHWVQPESTITHRSSIIQYLLDNRYAGAEVVS